MKKTLICLYLLLLFCPLLLAEETIQLEELNVTARPLGLGSLEHIAQPVSVLGGDDLDKVKSPSIGETLSNEIGVNASFFGPFASRPIIRGLGGPRVQVLQSGIGSMDVSTISVDHAVTIEPFQAQQIEIFRGPATLLYGSSASGGLVNMVTGRIPEYVPEYFTAAAETRFNSVNQEKLLAFRTDGGVDDFAMHVDGTLRDTNNYNAVDGEILNSGFDNTDVNIGSSYFFDRGFFGASFGRLESTHEVPLDPDDPEAVFLETEQDRIDFAAQLAEPFPGFSGLRLRAAHNDYNHTEFEDLATPGTVFFNDEWEGRLELQHLPVVDWFGSLGTQFNLRSFSAKGDEAFVPAVKSQGIAVFILEDTDVGNWHFELGGRFEYKHYEPTTISGFSSNDFDVYSIAGGTHWHFTEDYSLGLSLSRSQRVPAEEELFANGPHLATGNFEIGNPGLGEETLNNFDLSFKNETGRISWTLNLFLNYIEDFIFLEGLDLDNDGQTDLVDETGVPGGELLLTQIQQDNSIFYGAEAEAIIGLLQGAQGDLGLRLFGDYVRGKVDSGNDIPRISPPRLGGGLLYAFNQLQAGVDLIEVFKQRDVNPLETETDGYTLLNADVSYNFSLDGTGTTIFIRGINLFDQGARQHTSFIKDRAPLPGRSGMIGIRARF
ncbi:MAG: TonB-dependent receptor [Gammaproteobacteria bacterium]|nr:TonB-dependent receptor [Gammaproteobacteria bacterium]